MSRRWAAFLIGGVLAVAVPLVALTAAPTDQPGRGMIVSPFVWPRLAVVHLLTALPLSFLLAAALPPLGKWSAWIGIALAGGLAALTVAFGSQINGLDWSQAGFVLGLLAHCAAGIVLEMPWCVVALACARSSGVEGGRNKPAMALALVFAVIAPAMYAIDLTKTQSRQLEFALQRGRLIQARNLAAGPAELGSMLQVQLQAPEKLGRELQKTINKYQAEVAAHLPQGASLQERAERAKLLTHLERYGEAEQQLAFLGDMDIEAARQRAAVFQGQLAKLRDLRRNLETEQQFALPATAPAAARLRRAQLAILLNQNALTTRQLLEAAYPEVQAILLHAFLLQEQSRWKESDTQYRHALDLLALAAADDPVAVDGRKTAYDGLGYNAHKQEAYPAAEAIYLDALQKVPAAQAHFHYQLGKLYDRRRPGDALKHLELARRIDPAHYGGPEAKSYFDMLHGHTPGCMLRP